MSKVTFTVPVEVQTVDEVPNQVLESTSNKRFGIFPTDLSFALATVAAAAGFIVRELEAGYTATVTRVLHVVKSGTRFRVTVDDADGINIAEEAELQFKSFGSFGELVRRFLNGELSAGLTPVTKGTITIPGAISGTDLFASGVAAVNFDITPTINGVLGTVINVEGGNTAASVLAALAGIGTPVSAGSLAAGTGVELNLLTEGAGTTQLVVQISEGAGATYSRSGYAAGQEANALILDQVAGTASFARVASLPAGENLAEAELPVSASTSLFE